MKMGDTSPLPNFLIVGAQKSATRWLRINLGKHPQIFTADAELSFFNKEVVEQNLERYRESFKDWAGEPFVGEATPAYMMWRQNTTKIVERIDRYLPDVQLVALLRNPVDRTYSAFIHHMNRGRISADVDLLDYVRNVDHKRDKLALVSGGWYGASLAPYLEVFGYRIKVFLNDEAVTDPKRLYSGVLQHIGAQEYYPDELERVRHKSKALKQSKYVDPNGDYRSLTDSERTEILEYFYDDMRTLERLFDCNLDIWRK